MINMGLKMCSCAWYFTFIYAKLCNAWKRNPKLLWIVELLNAVNICKWSIIKDNHFLCIVPEKFYTSTIKYIFPLPCLRHLHYTMQGMSNDRVPMIDLAKEWMKSRIKLVPALLAWATVKAKYWDWKLKQIKIKRGEMSSLVDRISSN